MKKLKTAAAVCAALTLFSAAALLAYGSRDRIIEAEVGVVLGNEVYSNGQPSPRLAARLDKSVELYRAGKLKVIIVSGGVGLSRVDEATAMAAYLKAKAVPPSAIVIDSNGHNTWHTARFTADYLRKNRLQGAIAISQAFHLHRSVLAFKAAGCPEVGRASPAYWETWDIYSTLREIPANIYYWWRYA